MSLPPLASPDDLAEYLGIDLDGDTDEPDRVAAVLRHASAAVRVEAGRNWVDEEGALDDVPVGIPEITVQVAARHWGNPGGVESETTGPIGARYTPVQLTDGERAAVQRALRKPTSGLWTMATTREDFETGTVYVDVTPAGEPLPYLSDRDVLA